VLPRQPKPAPRATPRPKPVDRRKLSDDEWLKAIGLKKE
jgi:hypothetical protein